MVCTVTPSGTLAMAASAEVTCGLMRYVCAFHRLLTGKRKASTTTMATIMATP